MKIGLCGTGKMGAAMAERLMGEGHALTVWNRTRERAQITLDNGASWADSPAAVATKSEAVIVMVYDDAAARAVYEDEGGLASTDLSGKLVIEMSTIRPETVRRLADLAEGKGGRFVECPVGGTVQPAREGQLLGMSGGTPEAVEAARPILDQLCKLHRHVGPAGAGAAMKLAVNLPLAIYWEALGEAMSIAEAYGIDRHVAGELLANSSGAIPAAKTRIPNALKVIEGAEAAPAAFALEGMVKDLGLMEHVSKEAGLDAPLVSAARTCYAKATGDGWGGCDASLMPAWRVVANGLPRQ
ncbi:MAG TPA: NAD(P)-dependent oxidoreductase [Afifellaceae bacterium]|nr:NAD(P)-dependent oxidoreductase [Afifellaceae bacterium]